MKTKKYVTTPITDYLFLLPWIAGFLLFTVWPILQSFYLSFTSYDVFSAPEFVGIENYIQMFTTDKMFIKSLTVTINYVLLSVPIKLIAALIIAMILNQKIRGIGIYRTIYYLPSILGASVAMAVTWKMVLGYEGFLNQLLGIIGVGPIGFLSDPNIALITLSMLSVWQFGSAMIIFLAALKNVPSELYEAASIDGARVMSKFMKITLPMISPTILFNFIMGIITSFQVFTQAFVMTSGGPVDSTYFYVLHLYRTAFETFKMGYSSALAWFLTIIIVLITALTFKFSNKHVHYES